MVEIRGWRESREVMKMKQGYGDKEDKAGEEGLWSEEMKRGFGDEKGAEMRKDYGDEKVGENEEWSVFFVIHQN